MLYSDGPTPQQGITDQRNEYILSDRAVGGQVGGADAATSAQFTRGILPRREHE